MGNLRVFISYKRKSEKAPGDSEGVADALRERLAESGYEVFLDKGIPVGDEWHREIDRGLGLAHAAVVLLSPAALDSEWVRYELAVLSFRARASQVAPLRLMIALLGGVEPSALDKSPFDAMKVGAFEQFVPKSTAGTTLAANEFTDESHLCERIADELAKCAPVVWPDTKTDWLVHEVRGLLSRFPSALPRLAKLLDVPAQISDDALLRALAEALLRLTLVQFYSIADLLYADSDGRQSAERLIELVFPLWVHAQSAINLALSSERREAPILDAKEVWTVEQFVRRAEIHGNLWHVVDARLPTGEKADAVVKQFVSATEEDRFGASWEPLPDDQAIARLDETIGESVYFPLVRDVASAQALLRYGKAWIRPVVVSGAAATPPAVSLEPQLVATREDAALKTYRILKQRGKKALRQ